MLCPEDCIPGTLVECIDDAPRRFSVAIVRRGAVYTLIGSGLDGSGQLCVRLKEVKAVNPHVGFLADRFRLLPDERLSIFRQMLTPAPKQKERV